MDITERYLAYADAFEETYLDDDWSRIEPFFTEDCSYDSGSNSARGRAEVMALLKAGIDGFDRKMDTRAVEFGEPSRIGNELHVDWTASFTKTGVPDFVLRGHEIATFDGNRIAGLRDEFEPGEVAAMQQWMAAYAAKL